MKFLTFLSLISLSGLALAQGVPDEAQNSNEASIIRSCLVPNTIAFTIDDGPTEYTEALLNALDDAGIKATFYINGANTLKDPNWEALPSVEGFIKSIYERGHEIGSHTYNHACFQAECIVNNPQMKLMDNKEVFAEQIRKNEEIIYRAIGKYPATYRAPFGDGMNPGQVNATLKEWLYEFGYPYAIHWDIETQDMEYGAAGDEAAFEAALNMAKQHYAEREGKNTLITLQHAIPATIERIIPWIKNEWMPNHPDMKFVKVSECLGLTDDDVYKTEQKAKTEFRTPSNVAVDAGNSGAISVISSLIGSIVLVSITVLLNYF